ncbi:unannotated protein [freshwater metagenome]|uniref:Unannotated protein n=1 Tax=freshwater metagenome TaxID=449393 RepID=A0A6J7AIH8_9ZZZZ
MTEKRNVRLTSASRTKASATKLIRHGEIALCSSAPSQIAPPIATARKSLRREVCF